MAQQAISAAARAAPVAAAARRALASPALRAAAASRLLVAAAAAAAAAWAVPSENASRFDSPGLTQPFGELGDVLLAPLARWDATWYLGIADGGYGGGPEHAFFPLYPLLVRALAPGGSPEALLLAATAVSLAAFAGALVVLHRLARLELGSERAATASVALLAFFPASLWFGAPYSESVFLLVSVGAFYAARTGRWAWAGALAALASATRSAGLVLLVPLAILYLAGPRADRPERAGRLHPIRRDAAWLALAPAGAAAFSLWLWATEGDPLAWAAVQDAWLREAAIPLSAAWDGALAAWDGVRQLASGSTDVVYWERAGGDPLEVARRNVLDFAFLVFALVAAVGVARRLPAAYAAYVACALALPLSFPVGPEPLMSLPRFVGVLFPLFLWLGLACSERRLVRPALVASALGLGVLSVRFASWEWVA
jgi:hypothetical protein